MKQYKVLKQKLKSTNGEFFIYRFLSKKCSMVFHHISMKCSKNEIDKVLYFYRDILELDVCN